MRETPAAPTSEQSAGRKGARYELLDQTHIVVIKETLWGYFAAIASVYSLRTWSPAAVFQSATNWS